MKDFDVKKIKKRLSHKLKKDRYDHTLGVAYTAAALAMRYDFDVEKAFLTGLLHDCAKAYSSESYIELCNDYRIEINDAERMNPQLLHAKLGAYYAKKKYKVSDEDVLNAILCHTTGKPDMSLLDKIVYIADYIEPNRNKAKRLPEIRKVAFEDLDNALIMILEDTINHIKEKNYVMDPIAVETYNFYIKNGD